jgi:hypothetical protein
MPVIGIPGCGTFADQHRLPEQVSSVGDPHRLEPRVITRARNAREVTIMNRKTRFGAVAVGATVSALSALSVAQASAQASAPARAGQGSCREGAAR